ncbi:sigma 54-interacting transcriptional regulator [bacterium]|nr:sigma 54-interacting transcriptional regulator [bacterium]
MINSDFMEYLPCGMFVLNTNGMIEYVNDHVAEITGIAKEDLINREFSVLNIYKKGVTDTSFCIKECMERSSDAIISNRLFLKRKDGVELLIYLSGRWHVDSNNQSKAIFCIIDSSRFADCPIEDENSPGERESFYNLVGKDSKMQEIYELIEMTSATNVNVVIQGESGTGKELIAAAIHKNSERKDKAFVRVNCSALTESLLESELFGHVKGSFTGAFKDRIGRFEEADGGTIFLDEIGEISPVIQVKLLHVLQERVIVRVGDNKEIKVDVRIISATNRNLRSMVAKNKFREDLFYRLNVFPIYAPSLRDRKNDIKLLCDFFLEKFRKSTGKDITKISPDAMRILIGYCWPGNVRELENCIEHSFVLCQGDEIDPMDLPHEIRVAALREGICKGKTAVVSIPEINITPVLQRRKKQGGRLNISRTELIRELELHDQNRAATARDLGISTVALWKKMHKFGIMNNTG